MIGRKIALLDTYRKRFKGADVGEDLAQAGVILFLHDLDLLAGRKFRISVKDIEDASFGIDVDSVEEKGLPLPVPVDDDVFLIDFLGFGKKAFISLPVEEVQLFGVDALADEDTEETDDDDDAEGGLQEIDGLSQGVVLIAGKATDDLFSCDTDVGGDGRCVLVAPEQICSVVHGLDIAVDDDVSVLVLIGVDRVGDEFLALLKPFQKDERPGGYLVVMPFQIVICLVLLAHRVRLDHIEGRVVDVDLSAREPVGDGAGKDGKHDQADDSQDDVQKDSTDLLRLLLSVDEGRKRAAPFLRVFQIVGIEDGDILLDDVIVMLLDEKSLPGAIKHQESPEKKDQHQNNANQNNDPRDFVHGNLAGKSILLLLLRFYPSPDPFVHKNYDFHILFTILVYTKIPCR